MKTALATSSLSGQLVQFFGLTYAISWLLWAPYYLPMGVSASALPYIHLAGSLGPMLAALTLLYREKGMAGIRQLGGQAISGRRFAYWLAVAILIPFVLLVVIISIVCIRRFAPPDWSRVILSGEFGSLSPMAYLFGMLFMVGLGEETGWRGFALPHLQAKYSAFTANLILTLFWAVWHWPLFWNPSGSYIHMNLGGILGWFFSLLTGGILFAWLFNSSGGNVLACALFHGLMDVVFMLDLNIPELNTYTGVLITFWGLYIWSVYKPATLSLRHKVST